MAPRVTLPVSFYLFRGGQIYTDRLEDVMRPFACLWGPIYDDGCYDGPQLPSVKSRDGGPCFCGRWRKPEEIRTGVLLFFKQRFVAHHRSGIVSLQLRG